MPSLTRSVGRSLLVVLCLLFQAGSASAEPPFRLHGDQLDRPTGYREWIYVGAPLTPNDMNDGRAAFPEFHSVYIDPGSWSHWKETGEFREGTILIKEMIDVASKQAASGNGYFMGEFIGLEAAIKSAEHFPEAPGGWAYFSFTNEDHTTLKERTAPMPQATCNACHGSLAADDFVFTQHYPVLRAGRATPVHAVGGTRTMLPRTLPASEPDQSGE
jgi:hypothetical protein